LTLYQINGSASVVYDIADGVRVKVNSLSVDAKIPSGCSISVKVTNPESGTVLNQSDLLDGNNVISAGGQVMASVRVDYTATTNGISSVSATTDIDFEAVDDEIIAEVGENEYTVFLNPDTRVGLNGAMVWFSDGCRGLVEVSLKKSKSGNTIPSTLISPSVGVAGDGELKFINLGMEELLERGEGLSIVTKNRDTRGHLLFIYPQARIVPFAEGKESEEMGEEGVEA